MLDILWWEADHKLKEPGHEVHRQAVVYFPAEKHCSIVSQKSHYAQKYVTGSSHLLQIYSDSSTEISAKTRWRRLEDYRVRFQIGKYLCLESLFAYPIIRGSEANKLGVQDTHAVCPHIVSRTSSNRQNVKGLPNLQTICY